jgi:hypothetical protein
VAVFVLFALSLAVTVITFLPVIRLMPEIDQLVVPLAVPLPPLSFSHVTLITPLEVSEELPPRFIVLRVVL